MALKFVVTLYHLTIKSGLVSPSDPIDLLTSLSLVVVCIRKSALKKVTVLTRRFRYYRPCWHGKVCK